MSNSLTHDEETQDDVILTQDDLNDVEASHEPEITPSSSKVKTLDIDDAGIKLIKEFEGFKTKAYKCSAGRWTIGYGHMLTIEDDFTRIPANIPLKERTWKEITGATRDLTKEECEELLKKDLKIFCDPIREMIKGKATQNQFNAMVSLAYNIGINAFKSSSVLKYHNMGNYKEAGEWFLAWRNATIKGVKKPILLPRRIKEKALYDKG